MGSTFPSEYPIKKVEQSTIALTLYLAAQDLSIIFCKIKKSPLRYMQRTFALHLNIPCCLQWTHRGQSIPEQEWCGIHQPYRGLPP